MGKKKGNSSKSSPAGKKAKFVTTKGLEETIDVQNQVLIYFNSSNIKLYKLLICELCRYHRSVWIRRWIPAGKK